MSDSTENPPVLDVVIVGAGVSGVDAAYHIQTQCPDLSFVILESRDVMAGTWSFWKYPGFRSDSYMSAYAFPWYKWPETKGIVDGEIIWRYVEDAAKCRGIDKKIRYSHRVKKASWCTEDACWTLQVTVPASVDGQQAETKEIKTRFIFNCAGYYDYETPFQSPIPGLEDFKGTVAVPQFWPQDLDYTDKRIVLIGSGATAITLLPSLAAKAGYVTMLQRSPSYVFSVGSTRPVDKYARMVLPRHAAEFVSYWSMLVTELIFIGFLGSFPSAARWVITKLMGMSLPKDVPLDPHFTPRYDPFQQRLGMCPDGDFFKALRREEVDIVTDVIEGVTEKGVRTKGKGVIEADVIVPATGLRINPAGGIEYEVDGERVDLGTKYLWRGCMVEGVPNSGIVLGYFANSWTPGADVGARQLVRVMKHLRGTGSTVVTPTMKEGERDGLKGHAFFDTTTTYIVSALDRIPKVTDGGCWTGRRNWLWDGIGDLWNGVEKGLRYSGGKGKDT